MSRREFSKVSPVIWRSKRFLALPDDRCRLLLLYLLTCQHQNSAGTFRLPEGYACTDLVGWTIEQYRAARDHLRTAGLIVHDEKTEEIFVTGWFQISPPMNPKHAASIISRINEIESDDVRSIAEEEFTDVNVAIGKAKGWVQNRPATAKQNGAG
jgi:hypothetical protein